LLELEHIKISLVTTDFEKKNRTNKMLRILVVRARSLMLKKETFPAKNHTLNTVNNV